LAPGAIAAWVAGAAAPAHPKTRRGAPAPIPPHAAALGLALAGFGLAALAGDGATLAIGLAIGGLATWYDGAEAPATGPAPATARLAATLLAAGALLVAVLLEEPARPLRFLCACIGAAALSGLLPLRGAASPSPAATVVLRAIQPPLAIGLLARLALAFAGGVPPLWWAFPLLLIGGLMAVLAGWRSAQAATLPASIALASHRQTGLAVMALGLLLLARAADLPALAALATGALLLLLAVQAVGTALAVLAGAALQEGGGHDRLDRLGGLVHFMPVTTIALTAGLGSLTLLPPAGAFAGLYLALQAVLAAPRGAGLAPALMFALVVLAIALAAGLSALATTRTIGIACLGRPRAPRTAGAKEVGAGLRLAWLALSGLVVLLGLLPGPVLQLFDPAVLQLAGTELGARAGVLALAPATLVPGYAPLPLAALLAVLGGGLVWLHRRHGVVEGSVGPAWQQGFAPAPPWLPFGDSATQSKGEGFLPPLPPMPVLHPRRLRLRLSRFGSHAAPLLLLTAFSAALAVLACLGAA
ncbi:MAG: hypothetical protein J0H67_06045, partial [Rhodospirillales bacterium]|nr:hypothetical protein [Rhodospirillales bacterium]